MAALSNEPTQFTYASAFAGVGGMSLGLQPLGGRGVIAWEHDPTEKHRQYAQEAHKLLHPDIPLHGDIRQANTKTIPDFDLLCFTPPCQTFSVAGNRGGLDDARGAVTFEALRIAKDKQPKALFMENVKGLLHHDRGESMAAIVHAINEIGYTVDFEILNSKHFGVAQNRERLYLIAIRNDLVEAAPWTGITGNSAVHTAKRRYMEEGARTFNFEWPAPMSTTSFLIDFLEPVADERYYLSDEKAAALVAQLAPKTATNAPTIERVGNVNPSGKGMNGFVFSIAAGLSPTITINKGEGMKFLERQQDGKSYRIRKLSPRECLRLQSVPEKAIDIITSNFSNARAYKFAGNGLTINVVRAIGERLTPYLTTHTEKKVA